MKGSAVRILLTLAIAAVFCLPRVTAQQFVGGTLEQNTVFSAGLNPYIVTEPLIVPAGITLTIEPGTQVLFLVSTSLVVDRGTLIADGQQLDPVIFTAESDNKWNGITFKYSRAVFDIGGNYLSGNILRHVEISKTNTAVALADSARIFADSISIMNSDYGISLLSDAEIVLKNSSLDQCSFGMSIKNSKNNIVDHCNISNSDIGIFFPSNNQSSFNRISNNTISNCRIIGIFMSVGQSKMQFNRFEANTVINNSIGLYLGNGGTGDFGYNVAQSNVIRYNDLGIKLSQDMDTIRGNLVEFNTTGISLVKAVQNQIVNNIIQHNSEAGVILTDNSNLNTLSGNGIYHNYKGIIVTHEDLRYSVNNLITYNALRGNINEALLFESGPQRPVQFNAIIGTADSMVLVNRFQSDLEAPDNWFGNSDTTYIDSIIYDYYDNDVFGKVLYKPFLDQPDPGVPISEPQRVIKRLAGEQVEVDWRSNPESDLAGYRVYFGTDGHGQFTGMIDAGADTVIFLDGLILDDTIAVTAYDAEADGFSDQFEGHESIYSYAIPGPWAGFDTLVCQGQGYLTETASAPEGFGLLWTSPGDGTFIDHSSLLTTYFPGETDLLNGHVILTLQLTSGSLLLEDEIRLEIANLPYLFAGNDTTISQFDQYQTLSANAGNYDSLLWYTTGDGLFTDPSLLITDYTPGPDDIASGSAELILTVMSPCGNPADTISLVILPAFKIYGKVFRDDLPVTDGLVVALSIQPELVKAVSTAYTGIEGDFQFSNLLTGAYMLYATTNPQSDRDFIPSYYTESFQWQAAYLLDLVSDLYDVDISMVPVNDHLPAGPGSISGIFNYQGKISPDDSIYHMPWFLNNSGRDGGIAGYPASNHTVLLMNPALNRVFDWTLTSTDGSFVFTDLPYGSYCLWGEKAGYTNSLSPVISLSPQLSQVEGVQLNVVQKTIEVILPDNPSPDENVILYPNPASDWLWFNAAATGDFHTLTIKLYDTAGRLAGEKHVISYSGSSDAGIDITDLRPGLYICKITSDTGYSAVSKITIAR